MLWKTFPNMKMKKRKQKKCYEYWQPQTSIGEHKRYLDPNSDIHLKIVLSNLTLSEISKRTTTGLEPAVPTLLNWLDNNLDMS